MHRERPVEREKLDKILRGKGPKGVDLAVYGMGVKFRGWVRGWWELGWLAGIGRWKFFGQKLGSFGILVTVMEAIRVKCGSGEGLLSLLFKPFTAVVQAAAAPRQQDNVALEQATKLQQQYDVTKGVTVGSSATAAAPSPTTPPTFETDPQSVPLNLDPTLQTEGLSFCPDLTLADPTGILPQALLATIVLSALFSPRALEPDSRVRSGMSYISNVIDSVPGTITTTPDIPNAALAARKPDRWAPWPLNRIAEHVRALTFPQKVTMFVGLYFYFIAQYMPAGMVLYLIGSWTVGFVQRVWLDVRHPAVTPILPCSRPVRVKRRASY